MAYKIITTTNARLDIQDAVAWEDNRSAGLSYYFLRDLNKKISAIHKTPFIGAIRYDNIRCTTTRIFPYLIHYTVDESSKIIYIMRIFHTARKPLW